MTALWFTALPAVAAWDGSGDPANVGDPAYVGDPANVGDPPNPSSDSSPGNAIGGWELPAWLELGGQIPGRVEDPSGASVIKNASNAYYLSRIRMHLGIQPTSWLRFFAEAQDARVGGYDTSPAPNTIYNPMDVRQAYVQVNYEGVVNVTARGPARTAIRR